MHVITTDGDAASSTVPATVPGTDLSVTAADVVGRTAAVRRPADGEWVTELGAAGLVVVPGTGAVPRTDADGRDESGDRLLLIRQHRYGVRLLEVPGGGQESGETLEETAAREVAEETGVRVDVGDLVGTVLLTLPEARVRVLLAYFRCAPAGVDLREPDGAFVPQLDEGIDEVRLADPDALDPAALAPLDREVVVRWWPGRHATSDDLPFHLAATRTEDGIVLR